MRKSCHLLASLAFFGWTGVVNAALMQEVFFYFPGDGTTVNRHGKQPSWSPHLQVSAPTPAGLCISPCWDTMMMSSTKGSTPPTKGSTPSTKGSTATSGGPAKKPAGTGEATPPGGLPNGPDEFDIEEIAKKLLEKDPPDPKPLVAVLDEEDDAPKKPGTPEEKAGLPDPVIINIVDQCESGAQSEICTAGPESTQAVPLPSTLLLFGLGLLGLARARRKMV